jgi:hypothetical protein
LTELLNKHTQFKAKGAMQASLLNLSNPQVEVYPVKDNKNQGKT